MHTESIYIEGIPATIWGRPSERVWLCVHGKLSSKDAFAEFAQIAEQKGCQTISFDLPRHGQRKDEPERCDIWNGIRDLAIMAAYVFKRWQDVSLYGCSLGAYFCLNAYAGFNFRKCLFQSPILDMEYLIRRMMEWFDITEARLEAEKEIETPIDLMSWEYYRYVQQHPIENWDIPTCILFAGKDTLQSIDIVSGFAGKHGCAVTVANDSEHPFMAEEDGKIVHDWLVANI